MSGLTKARYWDGRDWKGSQGNTLWSEGKLDEADAAFKKALQADPESSKANERLASLYLTQKKTGEAISACQHAITLDPENAQSPN